MSSPWADGAAKEKAERKRKMEKAEVLHACMASITDDTSEAMLLLWREFSYHALSAGPDEADLCELLQRLLDTILDDRREIIKKLWK